MTDSDKRRDLRTKFRAEVKVTHPEVGEVATHTSDISESGAFILSEGNPMPAIGEIVNVQVQGMGDGDAPVVKMRIARCDKDGIGLEYVDSDG
ncbi:PilZ domain-containing protein [Dasania marina]|uniref:PilZ domain-containing protein n=1 Tax=Dasania marina TaxID=471499 RepID=UPI0004762732|nr:PilZ domain-containing protein [Dasania marina]